MRDYATYIPTYCTCERYVILILLILSFVCVQITVTLESFSQYGKIFTHNQTDNLQMYYMCTECRRIERLKNALI